RAEVLGPRRSRVVTFIRKIEEVIPFPQREVSDDKLPEGKRVVTQRGIPGFKVRRYRIVREGPNAVREKTDDVYPPTLQIVHVGTGAASKAKVIEDEHPEYVADVYLAITQGPGVGKPDKVPHDDDELKAGPVPSGMEEVRVPGETGTKGWSKKYASDGGVVIAKQIDEAAIASAAADAEAAEGECEGDVSGGECKGVAKKAPPTKRRKK
ncbi:MAG: G5 domain-containing protein, partial [Polyangiales bacterium]